ncbi:MAG: carboxypeptidase regulatory-like domain-containing protein [Deltaproteobacteria bacterium]|nr:carboxypeptidase regulatory-like domain-containing protein [Deltaproteobacteria bacterium]
MEENKKELIGRILVQRFGVLEWNVIFALDRQKNEKLRLCSMLLKSKNAPEEMLAKALAFQQGVEAIVLSKTKFLLSSLTFVPEEVARQETVLPVGVVGSILVLAVADPGKKEVFEQIERTSGKKVAPHVAVEVTLKETIEKAYHLRGIVGGGLFSGATHVAVPGTDPHLEILSETALPAGIPVPKDDMKVVSTAEDIENIVAGRGVGGGMAAPPPKPVPMPVPDEVEDEEEVPEKPQRAKPASAAVPKAVTQPKFKLNVKISDPALDGIKLPPRTNPAGVKWMGLAAAALAVLVAAGIWMKFGAPAPGPGEQPAGQHDIASSAGAQADPAAVGVLKGKVLDAAGNPIRGASARVRTAPHLAEVFVDQNGAFVVRGLVPGGHRVQATLPEGVRGKGLSAIVPIAIVNVAKTGDTPALIGGSEGKGIIEGTVVRKKKPVAGADITLFFFFAEGKSEEVLALKSGDEGDFAIFGTPPGKYVLEVRTTEGDRTAREITVAPGSRWRQELPMTGAGPIQEETPVAAVKTDEGGPMLGSITGTVADGDGTGLPGVPVRAIQAGKRGDDDTLGAITDSNGGFAIESLPVGVYTVEARAPDAPPVMQRAIRVRAGTPVKVRLVAGTGVTLKLRLYDLKGRVMTGGHLVVKREGSIESAYEGQGDFEGTNVLSGLAPGRYRVHYQGLSTLDKRVTWAVTLSKNRNQAIDLSTTTGQQE